LQGVRSDAVLASMMCGRPSKACAGSPRRIQARWAYPFLSVPPYHSVLRWLATRSG
jgi:hypothetical protein